jgi:hypothetical protein
MNKSIELQIVAAEQLVHRLRMQLLQGLCRDVGHNWQFHGGKSGCDMDFCECSASVYVCSKCGDCDYGDNEESADMRAACIRRNAL